MSYTNLPGPLPQGNPPPGAPGAPGVATDPARQGLSLQMVIREPYGIIYNELGKPNPDPVQLMKAQAMMNKLAAMRPQAPMAQPSGVSMTPQTGVPQPVGGGMTDALTGMAIPQGPRQP